MARGTAGNCTPGPSVRLEATPSAPVQCNTNPRGSAERCAPVVERPVVMAVVGRKQRGDEVAVIDLCDPAVAGEHVLADVG